MRTATLNPPFDAPEAEAPNTRRRPLNYGARIWTGFGVALASLLLVGTVGIYSTRALINRDGWVLHARIVIDRLAAIDSSVKSVQGGLLGYAASGDEHFLRRAQVAGAALDREVGRIRQLVGDSPDQVQRSAHLALLLDARRELTQRTFAIAAKSGFTAAASGILHGPGLALTDEISRQVAAMSAIESALLAARDAAAESAAMAALIVLAFGSLLGVSFVGLAGVFFARALAALRLRNRELAHSEQRTGRLNQELSVERTSAERRSHEQARLAAVVQSSNDAIISGSPDGVIASFNSGAERLYGYAADEVIGRNLAILEPPDDVGEIAQTIAECFTRRGAVHYETRHTRKDGSIFDAESIDSPIYAPSGREIGFSAIVRDISERRQSERILAERTRDLERSNIELEQFAYSASHDLQEPLRMVGSYVQLLRDRYRGHLDSEADEFIDFAVDGAARMKQLINDFLLYARTGRGHVGAVVEAGAALDWAVANLALKLSDSAAVIIRGEMPPVIADPAQLGQLFQNLIDNALKFRSAAPPKIEVEAVRRDDLWEFCVRDNGIGIDQKHTARIFQMFQRLHSNAEYPGTGIGLAICRKIVERNGGSIWVDAAARPGTAFRFTIPAAASDLTALKEVHQI